MIMISISISVSSSSSSNNINIQVNMGPGGRLSYVVASCLFSAAGSRLSSPLQLRSHLLSEFGNV